LEEATPEWERLFEACPLASPFQSPAWLLNWWRVFGRGDLLTIALRQNGTLVGIAPLYIDHGRAQWLGTGISDYCDLLIAREAREEGSTLLLQHLRERRARWRRCELKRASARQCAAGRRGGVGIAGADRGD
jgi:CelD/BcsL family acetyltransferase involved in cellulose biosynthesis